MGNHVVRVCAALGACLAVAAAAHAAPLYTLLDLGSLDPAVPDNPSRAYGINELGQVVGSSFSLEGRMEAYRTAPNSPINPLTDGLGTLGGPRRGSEAYAINDLGQVVGWVTAPDTPHAFFTAPNQRIDSHMGAFAGGTDSYAWAINNTGQVAGFSSATPFPSDPIRPAIRAFRTPASRPLSDTDDLGALRPAPEGRISIAYGINDRGQAVGVSADRAFRTAPNAPINPATDDLGTLGADSVAKAINSRGQVVGDSGLLGGGYVRHAFRTSANASINPLTDDLGTLGGARSFATDINEFGVVVGNSTAEADVPGNPAPDHAFVYIDGEGMLDLNDLIANRIPEGWTLAYAEAINNKGQIAGEATLADVSVGDNRRAFLLTPVPEPALGGVALAALVLTHRRFRRGRRTSVGSSTNRSVCPAEPCGS